MCIVLLMGSIPLLPHIEAIQTNQLSHVTSIPATLVDWRHAQRDEEGVRPNQLFHYTPNIGVVSPKHQLIDKIQAAQLSPNESDIQKHESLTTRKLDPQLPKIIGTQMGIVKQSNMKHPKTYLKPPSQLTLFDTLPTTFHPTANVPQDIWGHSPEVIDVDSVFRVYFNNINGLKLTSDPLSVQYSLSLLQSFGAGGTCIAEANVNWGNYKIHSVFKSIVKKIWKHSSYVTSCDRGPMVGEIQPGGTLTLICDKWTSRIIEKGSDPYGMGRWSYLIMRGQDNKQILLVTAYRVCVQTISSAGPTTSTSQQFRFLSKEFRDANIYEDPQPRKQFIIDLQAWLEHKNKSGCYIILAIDANEGMGKDTGMFCPLEYTLDHPISTKGHDGSISTLVRTCGLCDPLLNQHTETHPPPTYRRGRERIDFIFVSVGLLTSITRSGILPYDQYFIADHRPCYLDFDSNLLFGSGTPTIAPSQYRGLQLHDPRIVATYKEILHHQLKYHKLEDKISEIYKQAQVQNWSNELTIAYEKADQLMTESMLMAERSVSRKISTTYAWSPKLKAAVSALRYWKLNLKRAHGQPVSDTTLRKLQNEAGIDLAQLPSPLFITDVVNFFRTARAELTNQQKHHLELRSNHLQELAEARVLVRSPALESPEAANKLAKCTARELHRIQYKEKKRQLFQKIGHLLYPERYTGGLSSIDIPADAVQDPYPIGPDPQTWQKSWKPITDPMTIIQHISAANARQYNQAHETPFGTEPLKTYFGYKGDTVGAEQLIGGTLPTPNILQQLLPETQSIIQYLATFPRQDQGDPISPIIKAEQFRRLYNSMDERTSSSPSGRHLGHYKVAAQVELLTNLHSMMMSIPYMVGFSPRRWRQVIDVMLEKKPGERKIHRLRIVALQESDFNQSNRLLFGRPLQHALEDAQQLPDIQHGSRASKRCHSAVLNKVLTYEIHRYRKQPLAYIENDAKGCFDRIINPLVIIFLRVLGVSATAVASLAATWEQTFHRIKTLYGISSHGYGNHPDYILFGPGQGSTIGPFLWLLCFLLISSALSPVAPKITIQPVNGSPPIQFVGEAFVDDAGLGTNSTSGTPPAPVEQKIITNLQSLAQEWERLLFSTGGALNLQKCFWFLMSWRWIQGRAKLHTSLTLPGQLLMTSGAHPHPAEIKRIAYQDLQNVGCIHYPRWIQCRSLYQTERDSIGICHNYYRDPHNPSRGPHLIYSVLTTKTKVSTTSPSIDSETM